MARTKTLVMRRDAPATLRVPIHLRIAPRAPREDKGRVLQLQVQLRPGATWETMLRFTSTVRSLDRIKYATHTLGRMADSTAWRIATTDSRPVPLMHWSAEHGWRVA